MDTQLFLTIILWLMIGSATAYYAYLRGRDPLLWFMIGMMLGLLGLLLLFLLPVIDPESAALQNENSEKPLINAAPAPQEISHDYMIKEWYYYNNNRERQGPVHYESLKLLWQAGDLNENSFVWSEGMDEWKEIEQIPSLYAYLVLHD